MKMKPVEHHILFSEAQAAARLRIHPDTLRRWRYAGSGPPWINIAPHRKRPVVRYRSGDLREWIAARAEKEGDGHADG